MSVVVNYSFLGLIYCCSTSRRRFFQNFSSSRRMIALSFLSLQVEQDNTVKNLDRTGQIVADGIRMSTPTDGKTIRNPNPPRARIMSHTQHGWCTCMIQDLDRRSHKLSSRNSRIKNTKTNTMMTADVEGDVVNLATCMVI